MDSPQVRQAVRRVGLMNDQDIVRPEIPEHLFELRHRGRLTQGMGLARNRPSGRSRRPPGSVAWRPSRAARPPDRSPPPDRAKRRRSGHSRAGGRSQRIADCGWRIADQDPRRSVRDPESAQPLQPRHLLQNRQRRRVLLPRRHLKEMVGVGGRHGQPGFDAGHQPGFAGFRIVSIRISNLAISNFRPASGRWCIWANCQAHSTFEIQVSRNSAPKLRMKSLSWSR